MGSGRWVAGVAVVCLMLLWPAAALAQVNAFSISADRDVEKLDGRSKSYEGAQARFTSGPQPIATDAKNRRHKQIAGAVQSNIDQRTYIVRVYLPTDALPDKGRTYAVNGGVLDGGTGMELTLDGIVCVITSGSFTVNEYAEQADGTPTVIDISFTGTGEYAKGEIGTFTGRFRLNAGGPPAPAPSAPTRSRDTVRPTVSGLRLRHSVFRAKLGTRLRFHLSEAARTTLAVERRTSGRRMKGHCYRTTRRNAGRQRCVRYARIKGAIAVAGRAGENRALLPGRIGGHSLRPGRYRLIVTPRDGSGNVGKARRLAFRVKR